MSPFVARAPKVRHCLCRPFGPLGYHRLDFPALTDGATNCRSFGPDRCWRLKLNQYPVRAIVDACDRAC
jgi:hypothetical protein